MQGLQAGKQHRSQECEPVPAFQHLHTSPTPPGRRRLRRARCCGARQALSEIWEVSRQELGEHATVRAPVKAATRAPQG